MTRARWILLVLVLVGAALRFYRAGEMCLRADEAVNFYLALKNPDEIMRAFLTDDPHQPLYFVLLHFWLRVAGTSELALRFPTMLAGIALVALVYVLARQFFPRQPILALSAAALVAINPALIWDAQDAYMYALLTPTLLVSFIAFGRVLGGRASRGDWLVYIVASAVSLYWHYFAAFALVAQGAVSLYLLITRQATRRQTILWLGACIAIGLLFLPWLVLAFPLLLNFQTDFLPAASLGEMLLRALQTFSVGRIDARLLTPMNDARWGNVGACVFLVAFVGGLVAQGEARARATLCVYLASALGAMFLFSTLRFPIFDERYVVFLTPIFLVLVARGVVRVRPSWLARLAFVLLALISAHSLYNYFYVPTFAKSPDWRGFTQQIVTAAQAGDLVLQNYPDPALPYYLRERVPRVLLPRSASATVGEVNADLRRLTSKYTRVWFHAAPYAAWDTEGLVARWLTRHARLLDTFEPRGLRLLLYQPAPLAIQSATATEVIFDETIRLRAFDCDTRAPNIVRITLYWQALAPPTRAATVFVHLYDAEGHLIAQQDSEPLRGTYPMTEWDTENIVVDSYALTIPDDAPAGKYFIAAGLYDSATHARWNAYDARSHAWSANRVRLCEVPR